MIRFQVHIIEQSAECGFRVLSDRRSGKGIDCLFKILDRELAALDAVDQRCPHMRRKDDVSEVIHGPALYNLGILVIR